MDTKDLRIGNILYANGEIAKVVAIDGTAENDFVIHINHGRDKVIKVKDSVIDIEPILLSDDFVTQLGLFDETGTMKFAVNTSNYKLRRRNGHVVLLNEKSETLVHFWDVKYLHKLQNLYYILAKEELEIKW